jgi:FlaA1/EpsC-like NDP-sugar epimerase
MHVSQQGNSGKGATSEALPSRQRVILDEQHMNIMNLIGRETALFDQDMSAHADRLAGTIADARFLVIGGAGSIGQAVTKEIFKRNPLSSITNHPQ